MDRGSAYEMVKMITQNPYWTRDIEQVVEHISSMCKALSLIPGIKQPLRNLMVTLISATLPTPQALLGLSNSPLMEQ